MPADTSPHDTATAAGKVLIAWLGAAWGSITMQDVVLGLTAIYTLAQLYVLVRDKIIKRKG